jgi:hypothetical protein
MQLKHFRWLARIASLVLIGNAAFIGLRWAAKAYKAGFFLAIPLAFVVPAFMTWLLFFVKLRELGSHESPDELYRSIRSDLIKFAIIAIGTFALVNLQPT